MGTKIRITRQGWFHVATWGVAVSVIWGSGLSVPTGSPVGQSLANLLMVAGAGLLVTSGTMFVAWIRQMHS